MNRQLELERLVTDWLRSEAPPRASGHVLATALERVAGVGQRRPLTLTALHGRVSPSLRFASAALALLALLGAAAIVGAMLRESPPASAQNGWVAYAGHRIDVREEDSWDEVDLYVVREGSDPRLFAGGDTGPERNVCPSFSPDGTRVAYAETWTWGSRQRITSRFVVVRPVDALAIQTGPSVLIPVPLEGVAPCPTWSRDGSTLAFLIGDPARLATAPADGSADAAPIGDPDLGLLHDIAWSPDGGHVLVAGSGGVWLIRTDGGPRRQLHDVPSSSVSWSGDGSRIVVVDSTAGTSRVLLLGLDGAIKDLGPGIGAAWSPVEDRIAYHRLASDGTTDAVVVVDPDGGDQHVIPFASLGAAATHGSASEVVWSPDGRRLVYIGGEKGGTKLVSVSATGDPAQLVLAPGQTEIASGYGLSWGPSYP